MKSQILKYKLMIMHGKLNTHVLYNIEALYNCAVNHGNGCYIIIMV